MSVFFLKILDFFQHHKKFALIIFIAIIGLLSFSTSKISFVEDISSFLPNNTDNKRINEAYRKIGAANKIVVTISKANNNINSTKQDSEVIDDDSCQNLLSDAAVRFVKILRENDHEKCVKEILYEVNNEQITQTANFIVENLPFYLTERDYAQIDSIILPQNVENRLKAAKDILLSPMGGFVREIILRDPLMFSQNALKSLEFFKQGDNYNTDNGFIFNDKGECLVIITGNYPIAETANNKFFANEIYDAANKTAAEFDYEIKIVPFGASLVAITNADRIKKDSLLAVSISSILILALLFYFFRNIKSLFFIAISVIFGVLFALGIIAAFKPTVSIIAIGISSIIFGIAINYPLHYLAHYKHVNNTRKTLRELINPLLIGNITTVGAFLSLLFISSPAMHDLGLFSAFLLVGTIFFVLFFLPQFLLPYDNISKHTSTHTNNLIFNKIADFSPENNKFIVIGFIVTVTILFFFSFDTKFEADMHKINYMTPDQNEEMHKLIERNKEKEKTVYVVAEGKTIDDALQNYENILPQILEYNYSGISNFFPSKDAQQKKINRWNDFWKNKKASLTDNLKKSSKHQGFKENVFDNFFKILNKNYTVENFDYFEPVFKDMGENYFSISNDKTLIYTILQAPQDSYSFQLLTSDNTFTFDDTSITQKMISILSDDFNKVLYICAFIVFAFLFFSFGRLELAILTFVPMAVGWVCILGLMNIFELSFNIVNIILATFIFGQGDDYTIFITEGLIYEYAYGKKMLASFKKSIILSATILFVAIGTLIFAKHPAMRSLAELTIVGMISVVACAYLLPPLIYRWLVYAKGKTRLMPITIWNLLKTICSFTIFLISSILITLLGFFILTIGGKTEKHKSKYHNILCKGFRILAKMMPQVKYKIHNLSDETFDKPAIITCNHQSHLDLLYTLMLSPKIITLTNRWVWNCPFYGWIIRYADFLPVVDSMEKHADTLKTYVDNGYSILIFPEGTRSPDCTIERFHKGALYLAEKFRLDILPLVIHGVGHIFPKQEFILRKGEVNVEIHARFHFPFYLPYTEIGENYYINENLKLNEIAKHLRRFYKEKYAELARKVETPDYFADKVLKNYYFKGLEIERAIRHSLKKNNNFTNEIAQLPKTGEITIQNTGYGEFALMAALVRKNLKITAKERDEEKFEIARNCTSVPENLVFVKQY